MTIRYLSSPPAIERLSSGLFQEVIITNTIPLKEEKSFPQLTILSVANLLGETIWRVHDDCSVSSDFLSRWNTLLFCIPDPVVAIGSSWYYSSNNFFYSLEQSYTNPKICQVGHEPYSSLDIDWCLRLERLFKVGVWSPHDRTAISLQVDSIVCNVSPAVHFPSVTCSPLLKLFFLCRNSCGSSQPSLSFLLASVFVCACNKQCFCGILLAQNLSLVFEWQHIRWHSRL